MNNLHAFSMAAAALVAAGNAGALTIIDTRPADSQIFSLGEPDTASYGQTFTVPVGDTRLDRFSIMAGLDYGDSTEFAFYVMAWDGTKATGPVLYSSVMQQIRANTAATYSFHPGVTLTAGGSYVAFLNTSSFFDGDDDGSYVSSVRSRGDVYGGGEFVFLNHGNDFSAVTRQEWTKNWQGRGFDLAFEARFSSAGLAGGDPGTPVEDGGLGTFSLLGVALFGMGAWRRRLV